MYTKNLLQLQYVASYTHDTQAYLDQRHDQEDTSQLLHYRQNKLRNWEVFDLRNNTNKVYKIKSSHNNQ